MRNLNATPQDLQKLIETDPLVAEKLRSVVLERLLAEAEAELAKLRGNPDLRLVE